MSFAGRRRSTFFMKHDADDSVVVSDSEDEDSSSSPLKKSTSSGNAQVINDSDTEGDTPPNSEPNVSENENSVETLDSEEEDRQFMNNSHMISIVEHSSDSDSESDSSETEKKLNKQKRRSIYDNPVSSHTPKSESTPIHGIKRKRIRKTVIYSESESENLSVDHGNKSINKSEHEVLQYSIDEEHEKNGCKESPNEENVAQSMESSREVSSYDQNSNEQSKDGIDFQTDSIIKKMGPFDTKISIKKKHKLIVDSDSELSVEEQPILKEKDQSNMRKNNVIDLTMSDDQNELHVNETSYNKEKKNNIVDLTVDKNYKQESSVIEKSLVNNNQESSDEILICSSTSTSENEIDSEVLKFVKKEVGVGNIDPVAAQKKEHYLIQLNILQDQNIKLNKFANSPSVHGLPDRGAKVNETIKSNERKIAVIQEQLAKLAYRSSMKNSRNSRSPSIKTEPRHSQSAVIKNEPRHSLSAAIKTERNSNIMKRLDSSDENNENFNGNGKTKYESESVEESDEFDVRNIPNVPQSSFDTQDLGKKALATLSKQQSLTVNRLEQLHGSLISRPAEDARDKDPHGLKIPLMTHQQHALTWMKWRECQKPKGGILADDMGLGKTLTMISLVLASLNEKESDSDSDSSSDGEWYSKQKKHKRYYGGTLVVCPASLIKQWEGEVNNRVKRGLLNVLVFHGNKRNVDDRKLSKYNIVVTTYQTLVREAELKSGMYKMEWNRVILDEAHYIRNHKSKACLAVCGLSSKNRWALTGTPIQNKESDLFAILKFLKCSPFDDFAVWKRWIENKSQAGQQRLLTIMKTLMLRRTKQELQAKGALESLPDKMTDIVEIEMDCNETLAYQKILLFSRNLFAQFLNQRAEKHHTRELYGGKFDKPSSYGANTQFTKAQKVLLQHHAEIEAYEILVLLLRLRQMCCHPALVHAMLDKEDAEVNGVLEQDDNANTDLLKKLNNMSLNEEDGEVDEIATNYNIDEKVATNLLTSDNPVFHDDRRSSKVQKIIDHVEQIIEKGDKLIIVSQWSSFLKVIAKNLQDIEDAKYEFFTGEVPVKKRQTIVDKINNPRDETNILLLSLTAGGVGLNLVGANHLLLIDIHWNPQLEAQAQDRIYRFGQKKDVHIYKFICKDTIEERVKKLQDRKLEISNHVLTGTRGVSSKLTVEDLKLLFS